MTENIDDKNKAFKSYSQVSALIERVLKVIKFQNSGNETKEITSHNEVLKQKQERVKVAFTLAETLIVLAVLGIVAAITIPPVVKQHMEAMGRTKIKKSMSVYDLAIQKMTVENDLKSDTELINWSNEVENCGNTVPYFKAQNRNGCTFKTSDGVWWNISDIMNPIIALSEQALNDAITNGIDGVKSFKLVASFDRASGAFRVDDLNYEKLKLQAQLALSNEEDQQDVEDNVEELEKLYNYINNKKLNVTSSPKQLLSMQCLTYSSGGTSCTKYEYDNNGNRTAQYYCDWSGNNCSYSYKYEYDSNGNQTAQYYCDVSGNNCSGSDKYEYDSNNNQTASYWECDRSGNNCSGLNKYEYDSNGNQTAHYYCDGSGNNCSYSYKYEYDSNNNQTAYYWDCDGSGNNCSGSDKYEYDSNGNKTTKYSCDGNGNNCFGSDKYEYDSNGNKTSEYHCDVSGNNCSGSDKYEYDSNNNQTAKYYSCDGNGNNCSGLDKYEYDSNGNQTAWYRCDGNGNNCSLQYKYENSYTER